MSQQRKQQVIALGRLRWTLRQIEEATGVRRETASRYLKAAGIAVRQPGRWGHPPPAHPAIATSTDSEADSKPAIEVSTDPAGATGSAEERPAWPPLPGRSPQVSACEPYREVIEEALGRRRNAMAIWQDLVDRYTFAHGYGSVRRFVSKLRGSTAAEACAVIETDPGEDYGQTRVMVSKPAGTF